MKNIKSITVGFFLAVAAMGLTATSALSAPITVPTSLAIGDQYRLVFVTSTTGDATSSNIADYNAFVTAVANASAPLNALGTTWTAIASTETVDARDNTSTVPGSGGVRIFLLNDTLLATDYADLWDGTIINGLHVDETGNFAAANFIWTGTGQDGLGAYQPLGVVTVDQHVILGLSGRTNGDWITASHGAPVVTTFFYSMSDILTVPGAAEIPGPGPLSLLGLGLSSLLAIRRRNRAGLGAPTRHCDRT
jgi:hypothetical protein